MMTASPVENQVQTENAKPTKDDSLVQIRKMLDAERLEKNEERLKREAAEKRLAEVEKLAQQAMKQPSDDDDDDDSDPYVDKKKLNRKLSKFEEKNDQKTDAKIERIVQQRMEKAEQDAWMKANPDYYDVIQHAKELHEKDPELVETISRMPDGFERNKLVYRNIKLLNLHKPPEKQPSVQDRIDQNRRSPYYQPTGVSAAPYASTGDFSPVGQKNAYEKMKELQSRLRI
jgi:hypothetical protein